MSDNDKEYSQLEKVFNQLERNNVKITDINMEEYEENFNEIYENEWFIVIDKQYVGECIGRKILDEKLKKDEPYLFNHDRVEILNEIGEITNNIRNDIMKFVYEYLDSNYDFPIDEYEFPKNNYEFDGGRICDGDDND